MNMVVDDAVTESGADLGDLSHSLGFLLRISQVKIFRAYFRHLGKLDMKPAEFSVLWVLSRNPGAKQGDIAQSLWIKPAHMTKLIQKLVLAELVERTVPEGDRRTVILSLTPAGADFVDANKRDFLDLHLLAPGHLNPTELAELTRLLRKYSCLDGESA